MPTALELQIVDSTKATPRVVLLPTVEADPILIGSDTSCGVKLEGLAVSPLHAELFCDDEFWCLRDRASASGTYLDGNRLFFTAIRLEVGQRIRLGTGDDAAQINVIAGAAQARDGFNLTVEVAGYVKAQRAERRRRLGWKIAVPSAGLMTLIAFWGISAWVVSRDQADRRAHPERYQFEGSNAATERLAAIMAGEARPEDVDVQEIIAAASFGRSSKLVDAALGTFRRDESDRVRPHGMRVQSERAAVSSEITAKAVDEATLDALIAQRAIGDRAQQAAVETRVIKESRIVTLRRVQTLLEARAALSLQAVSASPRSAQADLKQIEERLSQLGIDLTQLQWQPGEDLEAKIDAKALERLRVRLVDAMAGG